MKKNILFYFLVLFCTSCVTKNACERKFPTKDSIRTETIITEKWICDEDTFRLPSKEVTITEKIPCSDFDYHKSKTDINGLTETIDIHKGIITATCREDSLLLILKKERKERSIEKKTYQQSTDKIIEYRSTSWDSFCKWALLILLCLDILYILFAVITKKLPF